MADELVVYSCKECEFRDKECWLTCDRTVTAEEARRISYENTRPLTEKADQRLRSVYRKIRRAAKKGRQYISLRPGRLEYPENDRLTELGYTVTTITDYSALFGNRRRTVVSW